MVEGGAYYNCFTLKGSWCACIGTGAHKGANAVPIAFLGLNDYA